MYSARRPTAGGAPRKCSCVVVDVEPLVVPAYEYHHPVLDEYIAALPLAVPVLDTHQLGPPAGLAGTDVDRHGQPLAKLTDHTEQPVNRVHPKPLAVGLHESLA
ncbi:hypothetical protein N7492_007936 [Penicillium capsulatum]|uniref:Uncharacterized protein n=1 Tax=Penicillium capsulatum TaxID=69766 RepID=A0A9W9LM54_9EURO|nr:hypothetical protein N7492_007936 [Penicillium capsulatum]